MVRLGWDSHLRRPMRRLKRESRHTGDMTALRPPMWYTRETVACSGAGYARLTEAGMLKGENVRINFLKTIAINSRDCPVRTSEKPCDPDLQTDRLGLGLTGLLQDLPSGARGVAHDELVRRLILLQRRVSGRGDAGALPHALELH